MLQFEIHGAAAPTCKFSMPHLSVNCLSPKTPLPLLTCEEASLMNEVLLSPLQLKVVRLLVGYWLVHVLYKWVNELVASEYHI